MTDNGNGGTVKKSPISRTAEESETSARTEGQRRTSMLWETTQREIALLAVRSTLLVAGISALFGAYLGIVESVRMGAFVFLYGTVNLVVGFYFGRTNHERVGGPGGDDAGTR